MQHFPFSPIKEKRSGLKYYNELIHVDYEVLTKRHEQQKCNLINGRDYWMKGLDERSG